MIETDGKREPTESVLSTFDDDDDDNDDDFNLIVLCTKTKTVNKRFQTLT